MEFKIEKSKNYFILTIDKSSVYCNLSDLENIKTHLDYFIKNDSLTSIAVKIGDDEECI